MDGADGIRSDLLQAGGHRVDPGHVHQLSARDLDHFLSSAFGRLPKTCERFETMGIVSCLGQTTQVCNCYFQV